jgi:hypothetical protein
MRLKDGNNRFFKVQSGCRYACRHLFGVVRVVVHYNIAAATTQKLHAPFNPIKTT